MKSILIFYFLLVSSLLLPSDNRLKIPELIDGGDIELNVLMSSSGTTGYNGDYLGPTIRVKNGEQLKIHVNNRLKERTTVHWHGLHVPAEFDGGPHQVIESGESWNPQFRVDQKAATLWYHPHLMGKTAEQVYSGLAGMFYIEDDYSKSLDIPHEYGVNDIPLIIQDRRVDSSGAFEYRPSMHDEVHGYIGNRLLVNGSVEPELNIDRGTYRLRLLNGSNSSIYRLRFEDNHPFTVIASDGGFIANSVERTYIILSPGERYEILVDVDGDMNFITDIYNGSSFTALKVRTTNRTTNFYKHPESFQFTPVEYDDTANRRSFIMESAMMGRFLINGKSMSMDRIDFSLNKNSTEIWTIENRGRGMMQVPHSFHVHDVQFNVLSINGKRPDPLYSGNKDTILIMPGEVYKIVLRFEDYTGLYMYHCHFLEHEDGGMMGQFLINDL